MDTPHRDELLGVLARSWDEVRSVVDGYGEEDFVRDLGDGWRVKDAIAHVAMWERIAARKLTGIPLDQGDEFAVVEPWDLDTFNEAMRERWRGVPVPEILVELNAAHAEVVDAVTAAPDAECAKGARVWTIIDEDCAGHYHFHLPVRDLMAGHAW